ncbi:MAG: 1-acyl-sn-glycerol-3-phosphate acyltransferase [Anaerolineaceae bacterium]
MVTFQYTSETELRKALLDEIVRAVGLPISNFWRKFVEVTFWIPISRFSKLGSYFDQMVYQYGFSKAVDISLKLLVEDIATIGEIRAPATGPLLVVSNHPGTYDALCLASKLPRDDVKIVSSNIPFLKKMKNVNDHFLFASVDSYVRMLVIRNAIRHLEKGGAVIIFPSAHMDPEPSCMPGAMEALDEWSKSIEIFVNKVPETVVQVAIVSRVLTTRYLSHPLTHLRKGRRERQRIAEFLQIINQMVYRRKFNQIPQVSFGEPFTLEKISPEREIEQLLPYAIHQAKQLMTSHLQSI